MCSVKQLSPGADHILNFSVNDSVMMIMIDHHHLCHDDEHPQLLLARGVRAIEETEEERAERFAREIIIITIIANMINTILVIMIIIIIIIC